MKAVRLFIPTFLLACVVALGGCAGGPTDRSTGEYIDDATITARVKSKLIQDPVTAAFRIDVDTFRGNVQLNGFVDSEEEKAKAGKLAQEVEGVQRVSNNLEITTQQEG